MAPVIRHGGRQTFRFHTGSIKSLKEAIPPLSDEISFDSILVRLKVAVRGMYEHKFYKFRFHTGSIKRTPSLSRLRNLPKFRFHTGSIKSVDILTDGTLTPGKFRFHTGSIKSSSHPYKFPTRSRFRFHTGSIKSRLIPVEN